MAVTRCVCFQTRFRDLWPRCQAEGWTTVAEIAAATQCGTGCGGCRPYLRAMLTTGHTCFAVRDEQGRIEPADPDPWDLD